MTDTETKSEETAQAAPVKVKKVRKWHRKPKDMAQEHWDKLCADVVLLLKNLHKQATAHGYYESAEQRASWTKFKDAVPVVVPDLIQEETIVFNLSLKVKPTPALREEWGIDSRGRINSNKFVAWWKAQVGRTNPEKLARFVVSHDIVPLTAPETYGVRVAKTTTYGEWPKGSTVLKDGEAALAKRAAEDEEFARFIANIPLSEV